MIQKLRFKFVLINMSIVTLMLCVILGLVFYFTSADLEQESIRMMQNIAAQPFQQGTPMELGEDVRLPFFTLQLGPRGELLSTGGGYYDLSDGDFLDHLVQQIFASPKRLGVLPEYNLRYTITLGDFSTMDSQRYVSIGDGNVYLVQTDPLDYFDLELRDLIDQDDVPYLSQAQEIRFSGTQTYTVTYEEDSPNAYCEEDRYYTQQDGETLSLDTSRVEDYLNLISYLDLTNYVTYTADEEMLAQLGLDDPELVISVDYVEDDEDGNEVASTFQLSVSRDPEERQAAEEAQAEDTQTDEDSEEEEEITAYARVGDSNILYQITGDEYTALMAASYDDLRHPEVLPVDFEKMTSLDITLDGTDYTITVQGDGDDATYLLGEEEVEFDDVLSALSSLSADSFTQEQPTGQEEIRLTVHLDREELPSMEVALYRYDGSFCLAQVDGQSISLVPRSDVVDLIEAIHAIVLNEPSA